MLISDTCSSNCLGVSGNCGSCCHSDRNWILGPIEDYKKFLDDLSDKVGRKVEFSEVFYDFKEGSRVFPHYESWQNPDHYPAFRVDVEKAKKPCVMYNSAIKSCSVYEIRPETCRNYFCDFLKNLLEK